MSTTSCLVLILVCIVYCQPKMIGQVLFENDPKKCGLDASLLSHISHGFTCSFLSDGLLQVRRRLFEDRKNGVSDLAENTPFAFKNLFHFARVEMNRAASFIDAYVDLDVFMVHFG